MNPTCSPNLRIGWGCHVKEDDKLDMCANTIPKQTIMGGRGSRLGGHGGRLEYKPLAPAMGYFLARSSESPTLQPQNTY